MWGFVVINFNFKKSFASCLVPVAMILIVLKSGDVISAVKDSLELCVSTIVPTLFPFMVLSSLFVSNTPLPKRAGRFAGRILGISPAGVSAFICGIVCGFPVGAKCASQLLKEKQISVSEAESLIAYSNNPGPLFVIGAVGSVMFGSLKIGILLYAIQVFSVLCCAFVLRLFTPYTVIRANKHSGIKTDLTDSICTSVVSILHVCAFIVFFAVVNVLISPLKTFMPSFAKCLVTSAIEITNGIYEIRKSVFSMPIKLSLVSFALGWSGMSVHMQVKSLVKDTGISMKKYYITRFCISIVNAFVTYAVSSYADTIILKAYENKTAIFIITFLIFFSVFFYTQKKEGKIPLFRY